jgi:predicted DNA-binding protein (MmcQ/YjbR family)
MALPADHPRGARFKAWRAYLLSKHGAVERHPFDPSFPVYFVNKKMFALYSSGEDGDSLNLKCWPDWSVELRQQYASIQPGYHMNKKHWNTLSLDASLPRPLVKRLIDHSYDLVSGKLKLLAKAEAKLVPHKAGA